MLRRITHRLDQFRNALFSPYTRADEAFAKSFLNSQEISLFNQLPSFEKRHSVAVARRMLELAFYNPELDQRKLVKLGLLHDIGKIAERNTVFSKSLLILLRFFLPRLYLWLAEKGRTDPRWHRFFIHRYHGRIGAEMLEKLGESSEILSIISKHDPRVEPFGPEDPIELKILQQSDSY